MDLKAYLRDRYTSVKILEGQKKIKPQLKKKKKGKKVVQAQQVEKLKIIDDDAPWYKRDSEGEDEDAPALVRDAEVTKMLRMEEMRNQPFRPLSEDGSGWVEVTPSKPQASSTDLSPVRERQSSRASPRNARHSSPDLSPQRNARHSSPDLSPQRNTRHSSPDLSPQRNTRHSSPDVSPQRNTRHSSPDLSPQRNARHTSPDLSPQRNARHSSSPDLSPQRNTRHSSPADLSPRRKGRDSSPDLSPPRKRSSPDLSPPRQAAKRRRSSPADLSPPRRKSRHDSDLSPPRRGRQDNSPNGRNTDLSPPRRRSNRHEEEASPPQTRKGGLQTASELKAELAHKREQDLKRLKQQDASQTGKGAETLYRRNGKVISAEELRKQAAQEAAKPVEKPLEWGQGLVQKRQAEARKQELDKERQKPFARAKDDADLDKALRNRVHWGDPMAHLVKKNDVLFEDFASSEAMRESGFSIPQEIPQHSWIKRRVPPPANRYDIKPGRHWDGVDRSNGFENQMFKKHNEKKAIQEHAYRWSVSDM